jgi:flagella basal body P-ring formation protein FlgA
MSQGQTFTPPLPAQHRAQLGLGVLPASGAARGWAVSTHSRIGLAPVQWWVALGTMLLWMGVLALAAGGASAHASTSHEGMPPLPSEDRAPADTPGLADQVHAFATQQAQAGSPPGAPRVEVILGPLDSRIKLAPCKKVRTYWPAGQRAWGNGHVGVRCEQGGVHWNVYWPVVVRVWVRGVVAMAPMQAGKVISPDDLLLGEVDLAAKPSSPLLHPADLLGRTLARAVQAGQAVRLDDLRARRYFAPGEPVALTVKGDGFQVAGQGTAITAGEEGQCARIRTDSGRVVCGVPIGERRAEITL